MSRAPVLSTPPIVQGMQGVVIVIRLVLLVHEADRCHRT